MKKQQEYPLNWPENWPRTKTQQKSQFKTSLSAAIKNVQDSLRRFAEDSGQKVEGVVISSNVTLMQQNPKDSGVAIYFTWDGINTCIAVDRYIKLEENLQAIHHVIEAERTKLRHGGLNLVRAAFRGYAALPAPSKSVKDPYEVMQCFRGITAEQLEKQYKRMVKECHPDTANGSNEKMHALTEAYEEIKKIVSR